MESNHIIKMLIDIYSKVPSSLTDAEIDFKSLPIRVKLNHNEDSSSANFSEVRPHIEYTVDVLDIREEETYMTLREFPNTNVPIKLFTFRLPNPRVLDAIKGIQAELHEIVLDRTSCSGEIARSLLLAAIDERQERLSQFRECL